MGKVFERATIASAFDLAKQDVYELAESMQEAAEAMPEQLNGTHAEAAIQLEISVGELFRCDPPSDLRDEEVTWLEWRGKKLYRPQRRDNVVNFLRAYRARIPENDNTEELRTVLLRAIERLEDVFFPGMSGRRAA